ncbi:DEDD exonuclease domain-containing protein [Gordonia effusa]|uniref:DEDD exonuclease domain-containing protein n=1 Tax=Gordonia effusa TaxID=263908 RepID=UPI0006827737|nr:DEDD exonuclease domain-containing protein [Gordonia effusa]
MIAAVYGGIDQPLFETPIVVVDLETTGGAATDAITEIGAVRIQRGEVVGEFATLVDPGREIPPQIVTLTGITTAMVTAAPTVDSVLPAFFEFARGAVLVAHNARFDTGFLRRGASSLHLDWPFAATLCTVAMARRILSRDEAPTVKLAALADLFDVATRPTHRALDDARATVEVFYRLLERIGNKGVHTYRELLEFLPRATPAQRAKRHLATGLPRRPGVYLFRGPGAEVLYVGTAVDLRRRVSSYFTGAETRPRMSEMVALATHVDHVECAHGLEAGVRELRLLAAHAPAYNRRSKHPHKGWWIVLTSERFSRLRVSRSPEENCIGPIANRTVAQTVADHLSSAAQLRTCTTRLGSTSKHHWCRTDPAATRAVGGCRAASSVPQTLPDYLPRVTAIHALFTGASDELLVSLRDQMTTYANAEMFETATRHRDRLTATIDALARCQRLHSLCAIAELVVARPDGSGGWEFAVIRHGRLANAGVARRGTAPMAVVDALVSSAQTVSAECGPLRGAPAEEAALIYRWITEPGARIVAASDALSLPTRTACRWEDWLLTARGARASPTARPHRIR